jgi:hypothetical protein
MMKKTNVSPTTILRETNNLNLGDGDSNKKIEYDYFFTFELYLSCIIIDGLSLLQNTEDARISAEKVRKLQKR